MQINNQQRESLLTANAAAKGYVMAVDTDGSESWIDPKTREVLELDYPEDGKGPSWKKTGRRYSRSMIVQPNGSLMLKTPPKKVRPKGGLDDALGRAYGNHKRDVKKLRDFRDSILPSVKIGGYTISE